MNKKYTFQSHVKFPRLMYLGIGIMISVVFMSWQSKDIQKLREEKLKLQTELVKASKQLKTMKVTEVNADGSYKQVEKVQEDTEINKSKSSTEVSVREETRSLPDFRLGVGISSSSNYFFQTNYRPWMGNFSVGIEATDTAPYVESVLLIYTVEF